MTYSHYIILLFYFLKYNIYILYILYYVAICSVVSSQRERDKTNELYMLLCIWSNRLIYKLCIFLQARHSVVCQKSLSKKRRVFDSSRQRAEGTDISTLKPIKPKVRQFNYSIL